MPVLSSRRPALLLSRREALLGGAGTLASLGGASRSFAQDARPLPIPKLIDLRRQNQMAALSVQQGATEFFPGVRSPTLGYNGSYLGPTLRVARGDDVQIEVTNNLRRNTTVHWHGLLIPAEVDGSPHQIIRPGTTWDPVLSIRQPAATLFYHSHVHGRTAEQVYGGLAGVMIVTDEQEQGLGLPSEYGVDDLPLVLQDRAFDNGELVLPGGMHAIMMGRRGDTILVNGAPTPFARVPRGPARLRLVNGSNARIFDLSFSDGRSFHWIASEGGLLEAPVEVRSLQLAPGQRAEVLVDFSNGKVASLETGPDDNLPMMMGFGGRLRSFGRELLGRDTRRVMTFEPASGAAGQMHLPERLASHQRVDPAQAVRRRRFHLTMGMGGMMGGMMGRGMMGRGGPGDPDMGIMGINGRSFEMDRIDERVRLGDVEIWVVSGDMMAHPFHIHGVHFEVLRRYDQAPHARDQGLRDTVLVEEPTELLVRFTQPAEKAPFMYHCHILEHEDNGMMGQFSTV